MEVSKKASSAGIPSALIHGLSDIGVGRRSLKWRAQMTYGTNVASLGVISGMTGSGGTVGALVTQLLLFSGTKYTKETAISLMGVMMLASTVPITFIYFRQWGGMFCGPSIDVDANGEDYTMLECDSKERKKHSHLKA
ncbi:hypothetical protein ACLOJK_032632 [Asimina triloba]